MRNENQSFKGDIGTLYLRNIPKKVRDQFAAACAMRKKSMNKVLVRLMKDYAKERLGKLFIENKPRKDKKKGRDRD